MTYLSNFDKDGTVTSGKATWTQIHLLGVHTCTILRTLVSAYILHYMFFLVQPVIGIKYSQAVWRKLMINFKQTQKDSILDSSFLRILKIQYLQSAQYFVSKVSSLILTSLLLAQEKSSILRLYIDNRRFNRKIVDRILRNWNQNNQTSVDLAKLMQEIATYIYQLLSNHIMKQSGILSNFLLRFYLILSENVSFIQIRFFKVYEIQTQQRIENDDRYISDIRVAFQAYKPLIYFNRFEVYPT